MGILSLFFMFSYVSGSSSFPKPLTPQEENKYIEEYSRGSEEAKDILIERNLRLVAHIAKKYSGFNNDSDDLISIGTVGLIKGITTFDKNRNIRLATYAARCIENEILMFLRASKKYSNEVYLLDPISRDKEGNEINLLDIIESQDDDIVDRMESEESIKCMLKYIFNFLCPKERAVIIRRYGLFGSEEATQREIAKEMGISRSYVSRLETKALLKLRAEFENGGS